MSENSDPLAEVKAMQGLAEAMVGLDAPAIARVLRWAVDHYGAYIPVAKGQQGNAAGLPAENGVADNGSGPAFGDFAELYAAASPESDADKTLVAGYWFQFHEGRPDFGAQELNTALKHLGQPIGNITTAFDNLKARRPQPVVQLRKAGTTRQARKTYKLTVAGKQAVELMIGQQQ